jgi:hypothetical protein
MLQRIYKHAHTETHKHTACLRICSLADDILCQNCSYIIEENEYDASRVMNNMMATAPALYSGLHKQTPMAGTSGEVLTRKMAWSSTW